MEMSIEAQDQTAEMRELTRPELSDVAGGFRVDILGYTLFAFDWGSGGFTVCAADGETYGCLTVTGGNVYTSSGPVP
jgi:hypothetical protein